MIKIGTKIIAVNFTTGASYYAELLEPCNTMDLYRAPLRCKVLRVLGYPNQVDGTFGVIYSEQYPLPENAESTFIVTRLADSGRIAEMDGIDYAESRALALRRKIAEEKDRLYRVSKCYETLLRHAEQGEEARQEQCVTPC